MVGKKLNMPIFKNFKLLFKFFFIKFIVIEKMSEIPCITSFAPMEYMGTFDILFIMVNSSPMTIQLCGTLSIKGLMSTLTGL